MLFWGGGGGGGGVGGGAQAPSDFKTTTIIPVHMIINGKGSNRLRSTSAQSCFSSFLTGQSNIAGGLYI